CPSPVYRMSVAGSLVGRTFGIRTLALRGSPLGPRTSKDTARRLCVHIHLLGRAVDLFLADDDRVLLDGKHVRRYEIPRHHVAGMEAIRSCSARATSRDRARIDG